MIAINGCQKRRSVTINSAKRLFLQVNIRDH